MDNNFLNCLLLFCILAILAVYLYQSTPTLWKSGSASNTKRKSESFLPIIFDTCPRARTGMPVHRVGPVHNFHQHFNKYSPLITCSKGAASIPEAGTDCSVANPTGIPEMGWRNWYLSNYSQNQVPPQDPFAGTSIRNFLDNMENVDNIYRKCL